MQQFAACCASLRGQQALVKTLKMDARCPREARSPWGAGICQNQSSALHAVRVHAAHTSRSYVCCDALRTAAGTEQQAGANTQAHAVAATEYDTREHAGGRSNAQQPASQALGCSAWQRCQSQQDRCMLHH